MIYGIYKYNEIFMYNVVGGMIELYPGGVNKSKDNATQQNKQEHNLWMCYSK